MISFCILTNKRNVSEIIRSIRIQHIPKYEILIAGPSQTKYDEEVREICITEIDKQNWITKKKNTLIKSSNGEIIVLMKDYITFCDGWYTGLEQFGAENEWDICMNKIHDDNDERYLDWVCEGSESKQINYNITDHVNMYIPGGIVIAKRHVFSTLFDEKLKGLRAGSDIIWSREVLKSNTYKFNPYSKCVCHGEYGRRYLKQRKTCMCNRCFTEYILVGNGCELMENPKGEIIDKYKNVVRFNRFQIENFKRNVGCKIDTIFCNDFVFSKDMNIYDFIPEAEIIIYNVRKTEYNAPYENFKNLKGAFWNDLKREIQYSKKQFFSTGFAAIMYYLFVMKLNRITITNFDFQVHINKVEYFNYAAKPTHRNHNFKQEKAFVSDLISKGRIIVI